MITTLIIFIFVLGLLVFVHEFGHFIVARKFGVKAEEFGFGFPPRAIGIVKTDEGWKVVWRAKPTDKNFKNTIYSLNWIPLGGFVKIKGEGGENANDADSFAHKKIWQRASIIIAGVVMNTVLAAVFLSIGFLVGIPRVVENDLPSYAKIKDKEIRVVEILKDSPAEKSGIMLGDKIININGEVFGQISELQSYVGASEGKALKIEIKRGSEDLTKEIAPVKLQGYNVVGLGVGMLQIGTVSYDWYVAPWEGVKETGYLAKEIFKALGGIIKNLVQNGEVAVEITGPVGIAVMTGEVARLGLIYLLQFTALLSINLAIINFFPFPALDGGRLFFMAIEKIRGKQVNQQIENLIHNIGFILLLALVVLITFKDLRVFGGRILSVLKNSLGL